MEIFAETDRLILREVVSADKQGMFELDSDPLVHQYLGRKPVLDIKQVEEAIRHIRQQYVDNGIGRWAIVEKSTNKFLGWTGLKLVTQLTNNHIGYYDIGYRLIRKYWGKGFATESAIASLDYGFDKLQLSDIYGIADVKNTASRSVLEKIGLQYIEKFDLEGDEHDWLQITRPEWLNNNHPELVI